MSKWNTLTTVLAVSALFAAPTAFADGIPGQQVNRGPAPLQAQALTPPRDGCVLIDHNGGKAWSCPALQTQHSTTAPAPRSHSQSSSSHVQTTHYGHRTDDHPHAHGPVIRTYSHTSAPVRTTQTYSRTVPAHTTRRVVTSSTSSYHPAPAAPAAMTLDIVSFSGGVGTGVDGGFYGGGGTVFFGSDTRYSGVLSHAASQFTFRQNRGGKKRPHTPRPGPCGC